jgi:hypothetical protein
MAKRHHPVSLFPKIDPAPETIKKAEDRFTEPLL